MKKDYTDLKVGTEFELIEVKRSYLREWTRTTIALVIVAACVVALLAAAYFEIGSGDGNAVLKVWAVVGPLLASVTTYYFRGSKPGGENNDQGSV